MTKVENSSPQKSVTNTLPELKIASNESSILNENSQLSLISTSRNRGQSLTTRNVKSHAATSRYRQGLIPTENLRFE